MSGPSDAPPPYPGFSNTYSQPSDFSAFPPPTSYPPAPAPYDPAKGGSYPPPPPQYYGTQPPPNPSTQQHTTVVVAQPTVTLVQTFRESPVRTRCNHCSAEVVTATHFETGTFAWVICFVLWLVGCGLGCCLIPFCVDGCKDVIHTCPNCQQQIARYSRM